MFSHQDIKDLLIWQETYLNPTDPPDISLFTHILVTDQGTYAIKIEDLAKLQHLNTIWGDKDAKADFKLYLDMAYRGETDDFGNPAGSATNYQKIFLKHINLKYNLGITLYKTIEDTDGIPIGWEQLTLLNGNTSNSSIKPKPCK